jgi:hypothetical protein
MSTHPLLVMMIEYTTKKVLERMKRMKIYRYLQNLNLMKRIMQRRSVNRMMQRI